MRARVLYWFRTPPGIKVGREPFDEEARRKIESQNPGLSFDWNAIASTPMPPVPEAELWRERRRAERAAKVARRQEPDDESVPPESEAGSTPVVAPDVTPAEGRPAEASLDSEQHTPAPGADAAPRKKRRRRGGRRRRVEGEPAAGPDNTDQAADPVVVLGADSTAADSESAFPLSAAADAPSPDAPSKTGVETSQE